MHWLLDAQAQSEPRRPLWTAALTTVAVGVVVAAATAIRLLPEARGWRLTVINGCVLFGGYGFLAVIALNVRRTERRATGYEALHVRRLSRSAIWLVPAAFLAETGARIFVVGIVYAFRPAWRRQTVSNVHLRGHSVAYITEAVIVLALVAPFVEEMLFRGILLPTLMQRIGFWPAALISSLAFGLFHGYQGPNGVSALILAINTAVFGLGQTLLVRYTGDLSSAIAVHGLTNTLAAITNLV